MTDENCNADATGPVRLPVNAGGVAAVLAEPDGYDSHLVMPDPAAGGHPTMRRWGGVPCMGLTGRVNW